VQYKGSCLVSRYDHFSNLLWQKEIGIMSDELDQFNLTVSADGMFIGIHSRSVVCILMTMEIFFIG
jgi:hypothetical protein